MYLFQGSKRTYKCQGMCKRTVRSRRWNCGIKVSFWEQGNEAIYFSPVEFGNEERFRNDSQRTQPTEDMRKIRLLRKS